MKNKVSDTDRKISVKSESMDFFVTAKCDMNDAEIQITGNVYSRMTYNNNVISALLLSL